MWVGRLAASSAGCGRRLGGPGFRDRAELLHQPHEVHDLAALCQLAVAEVVDRPRLDRDAATGWGDTEERTAMSASQVDRAATRSPSATMSSTRQLRSGNASNICARNCRKPSRPGPWPGGGFCSTKSSATRSDRTSSLCSLRTSFANRRSIALLSSTLVICPSSDRWGEQHRPGDNLGTRQRGRIPTDTPDGVACRHATEDLPDNW